MAAATTQVFARIGTRGSRIRPHVTPDPGVTPDTTPYSGTTFKKTDLRDIPPREVQGGPVGAR
jgi:hypothetical protein